MDLVPRRKPSALEHEQQAQQCHDQSRHEHRWTPHVSSFAVLSDASATPRRGACHLLAVWYLACWVHEGYDFAPQPAKIGRGRSSGGNVASWSCRRSGEEIRRTWRHNSAPSRRAGPEQPRRHDRRTRAVGAQRTRIAREVAGVSAEPDVDVVRRSVVESDPDAPVEARGRLVGAPVVDVLSGPVRPVRVSTR